MNGYRVADRYVRWPSAEVHREGPNCAIKVGGDILFWQRDRLEGVGVGCQRHLFLLNAEAKSAAQLIEKRIALAPPRGNLDHYAAGDRSQIECPSLNRLQ